jgi:hypothetical protein
MPCDNLATVHLPAHLHMQCAMSSWLWLLCMVATVWMSFILVSLDIIRRR